MISASIDRVLDLQPEWTAKTSAAMNERRSLVRLQVPSELALLMDEILVADGPYTFDVEGSDGAGNKSRIPWVRIFDEVQSPSAQTGFYVVLLFSANGESVYLSLNRGTTEWSNGKMTTRSMADIREGTNLARSRLMGRLEGLSEELDLGDSGKLAQLYAAANIAAIRYGRGECPDDAAVAEDLRRLLGLLADLYDIERSETGVVGTPDPREVISGADAKVLIEYCIANSADPNTVIFDRRHHIFRVENRNGKVFVLPSSDVAEALAKIWSSAQCPVFATYHEKRIRETISELMPATYVGSLAESQTRPVWEVLRVAGGFVRGLPSADASVIFGEAGDGTFVEPLPDKMAALLEAFEAAHLIVPDSFARQCAAAIDAGKHLLLVGPPGTGKTSVALALARYAQRVRMSRGQILVTGTTDWTSNDTLGGYWLQENGSLRFRPGFILQAVRDHRWLIIDEFNRADLDKCLGPFFTVLSGQSAILPFSVDDRGANQLVEILHDEGSSGPATYRVNSSWRMIGTMNTWDRDVLFEMSFALKRRLAVLEVPPLPSVDVASIVASRGGDNAELGAALAGLRFGATNQPLGQGIVLDFCAYESRLRAFAQGTDGGTSVIDALLAIVVPQFQHLAPSERVHAIDATCKGLDIGTDGRTRLRAALLLRNEEAPLAPAVPQLEPDTDD